MNLKQSLLETVILARVLPLLETAHSCLAVAMGTVSHPAYVGWDASEECRTLHVLLRGRLESVSHLRNLAVEVANSLAKGLDHVVESVSSVPEADDQASDR